MQADVHVHTERHAKTGINEIFSTYGITSIQFQT